MTEKNNKFKFVNDQSTAIENDTVFDDLEIEEIEESQSSSTEQPKFNHIKSAIIMLIVSGFLLLFGLLWQDDYSLMAFGDALWLAFAIEFFAGWILLVYNNNIFSPLLYGAKSFVLMFLGKRPKTDYYSYLKNVQDSTISSYYYIVIFISAFTLLVPALITLFILL